MCDCLFKPQLSSTQMTQLLRTMEAVRFEQRFVAGESARAREDRRDVSLQASIALGVAQALVAELSGQTLATYPDGAVGGSLLENAHSPSFPS